jgi:hypothetical protein
VQPELTTFVQDGYRDTEEYELVQELIRSIHGELCEPRAASALEVANQPGKSSQVVQLVFAEIATDLGFRSEKKGLFADYPTSGLRPDFFKPVMSTGILLEVERGKTTTNNMDLLDFWKCHLCESASHLFLAVPQELKHNELMNPKKEYSSVVNRLSAFFEPRNYTNVRSLAIFGY